MKPDYPLLGLLARRPASGYDIGKWLRVDGRFLGRKPSMTPIYRALAKLLDLGWVEAVVDPRDAAPAAKVYHLTEQGRQALKEWAMSDHVPAERPAAPDLAIRLSFAGQLGPEYALRIVRTELEFRRRQRAEEEANLPVLDVSPIPEISATWLERLDTLVRNRGWQATSLLIGWLETTERELARMVADQQKGVELQ